MYTENDIRLYHHGILGQKWGKKNGPPYPLDPSDHSAEEKKAGWKKSLGDGRNENMYGRNRAPASLSKIKKRKGKADRAREEAQLARRLATRYTTAMDKKADKRSEQAEQAKNQNGLRGTINRLRFTESRADRAREEAQEAKKLAERYTRGMDKKADKRQQQFEDSKNSVSEDYLNAHQKKPVSQMSDKELQDVLRRLDMERRYEQSKPTVINKGRSITQKYVKDVALVTATTLATKKVVEFAMKAKG